MKKLLALSVALALVGSAVFGQTQPSGLTISGQLKTGVEVYSPDADADDTDATVRAYDDDSGNKYRARLEFKYLGENYGAWARLQTGNAGNDLVGVPAYLVWGDLFNNIIRVSVGNDDLFHPFRTAGLYGEWGGLDTHFHGFWNDPFTRGLISLEVKPIDGLDIGFNFAHKDVLKVPDFGYALLKDVFKTSTIAAAYKTDSLNIKAQIAFDYTPEVAITDDAGVVIGTTDETTWTDIVFGVKYTAGGLGVAVDGAIKGLGKDDVEIGSETLKAVNTELDLKVGYDVNDALSVTAAVGFRFFDALKDGSQAAATAVMIMPNVQYAVIPAVKVGLGAALNLDPDPADYSNYQGKTWAAGQTNGHYSEVAYNALTAHEDYNGFSGTITPYANFAIGGGAAVVVYDSIYFGGGVQNVFGVNCRWSF